MSRQEISIADIARMSGVSHSTVSRALHNNPLISREVRERIQRTAQEMGYIPNAIARSLQNQRTHTIGLITTSISDPFFTDIVKGVEEVTQAAGFSIILSISHNDPEQEMAIIETFQQRRVDGIIVASSRISGMYKERLEQMRIPTVLINSQADAQQKLLHWVAVDDNKGAQLAIEHLLPLGHRAIGYLGIESRPHSNQQRLRGYQQALAAAGIECDASWAIIESGKEASYEEDVALGEAMLPRLLNTGVTAVFCYNDMIAIGLLLACRKSGLVVPQQLSIISFDNIRTAEFVTPPLTTIHQPKVELGHLAMKMLLDLLEARPVEDTILSPTLKVRSSTAALHS
ncbi:MAG: substrate-binding domain-containing protein [Ktedonobacteraceae bacterium]